MYKFGKYKASDSMSALICENYRVLLVMSRFGIPLGFGDSDIGEVCRANGVHTDTFLTVVEAALSDDDSVESCGSDFSIESLVNYLQNSHSYFLEFRLPGIRAELLRLIGTADTLSKAIIDYFDEYVDEVRRHMTYEEENVFPYVRSLLDGKHTGYSIDIFRRRHDQVEARLTEFKNILIKYYPAKSTNEINSLLFDIFNCESDLAFHNRVEDHIFIPAIEKLENQNN